MFFRDLSSAESEALSECLAGDFKIDEGLRAFYLKGRDRKKEAQVRAAFGPAPKTASSPSASRGLVPAHA